MDLSEYSELEQFDFIEAERRELWLRFVEQTNHIFATATDKEHAKKLVDRLESEYFIGVDSQRKLREERLSKEILEMQKKTYSITPTSQGGILEISE